MDLLLRLLLCSVHAIREEREGRGRGVTFEASSLLAVIVLCPEPSVARFRKGGVAECLRVRARGGTVGGGGTDWTGEAQKGCR